jgi:hypothetical protein
VSTKETASNQRRDWVNWSRSSSKSLRRSCMALLRDADYNRPFTLACSGCRWRLAALQRHLHPVEIEETTVPCQSWCASPSQRRALAATADTVAPRCANGPRSATSLRRGVAWPPGRSRPGHDQHSRSRLGPRATKVGRWLRRPERLTCRSWCGYPPPAEFVEGVGLPLAVLGTQNGCGVKHSEPSAEKQTRGMASVMLEPWNSRSTTRSQCRSFSIRRVSECAPPALESGLIAPG